MKTSNKSFNYLGYRVEYSSFQKLWFVVDWDYEESHDVGPPHRSKYSAMSWIEQQGR